MPENENKSHIKITDHGPYIVTGGVPLTEETVAVDRHYTPCEYRVTKRYPEMQTYSLCRCGKSKTMPFCDGMHAKVAFDGCETADHRPFSEQAEVYEGPGLVMEDVENLCAVARFCHIGGNTWALIEESDDPEARELAIKGACNCPAGRLVVRDAKTDQIIEYHYEPSIALLRDEGSDILGPVWVRGGIAIESADGKVYEIRNRVTLCRCGKSRNMPFCDASHYR
jgi:CDGSH-type Zn-finger protein